MRVEAVVLRERVETVIEAVEHETGHVGVTRDLPGGCRRPCRGSGVASNRQRRVHDLAEAPAVALAPEGWPTGEGVVQIPVEEDLTLPLIWCG